MVPSSRSTFPRHWAWGHGAGTLCGARLVLRRRSGRRVLRSARVARRHGIGTKRAQTRSHVMFKLNWSLPLRRAVAATADRGQGRLVLSQPAKRSPRHA